MPNHWHFLLKPTEVGGMSDFLRWVTLTHTQRYHAHYGSSGQGHVYQGRFKSFPIQDDDHFFVVARYVERNAVRANLVVRTEDWHWGSLFRWLSQPEPNPKLLTAWPIARLPNWVKRVNEPLSEREIDAVRWSLKRGSPFGSETWVDSTARRLDLESTLRPRVHPLTLLRHLCSDPNNEKMTIAVGTAIAGRPPHRSVRAELPHTALPLGCDGRDVAIFTCRSCAYTWIRVARY
jgi:putative transposase